MWCLLLAAAAVSAADLPIREVVLYKHGVGYFQRAGRLGPGESARLDFKAGEMNDVLKSLTVVEGGGGRITGLRYDSSQPVEARLADFPFAIGQKEPLSAVLDQLKGARLQLGDNVAGSIVAARTVAGGEKQPEREQVTLMLDSGELRNFDLAAFSSIRFADPRLQLQFQDYLRVLADARAKEKRSVYIDSSDKQEREITAGYMLPMPVWKSSYRLNLGAAGAMLEGWAIVDNTTAEDWKNVRLSLVSGRPVSFISKLYEPRYAQRQVAELDEERALAPQVYDSAVAKEATPRAAFKAALPPPPPAPRMEMAPSAGLARMENMASSVATAEGREMGELFEYRIGTPVTVRKDESAMLPFLQQKLEARKLLIYSDHSAKHPMNAAELTNVTGKTLDGGPITVYDGGYAGEALVETVKAGDKRLISYAMDLGTNITTRFGTSSEEVREVHVRRGIFTASSAVRTTTTYTIRNVDAKPKTLIIERTAAPGSSLVGIEPSEKTAGSWRFEVKLAASATREFPITEESTREETRGVANMTPDMLLSWTRNKALSDAGRKQLEQIAGLKRRIADADAQSRLIEVQMNSLSRDQERIRQNINSLRVVPGQEQQVQNYARQLAAQESQIAGLRDRQSEQQRTKATLEAELNRAIESAAF